MTKEILQKINAISKENIIIAIDGHAGAGKTTLANELAKRIECNIIHMDDFFLPFDMRTKERFSEAGGNIHYERLKSEVIDNLAKDEFSYHIFNCSSGKLEDKITVKKKKITLIEGSYSMHPYFGDVYDLKIFCDISPKEQKARILARDGKEKSERFVSVWIPMENRYFDEYKIKENCDITVKTERTV